MDKDKDSKLVGFLSSIWGNLESIHCTIENLWIQYEVGGEELETIMLAIESVQNKIDLRANTILTEEGKEEKRC
ncbi:hypothetical protein HMPREF1982_02672 [Clostridiales bacterium oral taxon 876 str. F0540]|nr:hypothetical protein HMPREF1982_02672 [Clostridiales bacterium oral taxon 876 str. F0540]